MPRPLTVAGRLVGTRRVPTNAGWLFRIDDTVSSFPPMPSMRALKQSACNRILARNSGRDLGSGRAFGALGSFALSAGHDQNAPYRSLARRWPVLY